MLNFDQNTKLKVATLLKLLFGRRVELCVGDGDLPEPGLHLPPGEALEGPPVQGHLPQLCHFFLEK